MPQNGTERPFWGICVHSCVTALAVTPTSRRGDDATTRPHELTKPHKKVSGAIASLKRMHDKIVGDNPKACIRSPAFMGVLTATSLYAREVEEDIYVIPIRSLTP